MDMNGPPKPDDRVHGFTFEEWAKRVEFWLRRQFPRDGVAATWDDEGATFTLSVNLGEDAPLRLKETVGRHEWWSRRNNQFFATFLRGRFESSVEFNFWKPKESA